MEDKSKETLDAEVQDVETEETTEDENSTSDEKYASQKKRAEKAEAIAKEAKAKLAELETKVQSLNKPEPEESKAKAEDAPLSREDAILYAKGKTDAQVAYASKVAELEGISKVEALENPLYVAWEDKQEQDATNSKAQLGASRGSVPHSEKTFADVAGDDKAHRALFNEKFGQ